MSEPTTLELPPAIREQTLARFEEHRRAWQANPALRISYATWYERVRRALPAQELGAWVEVGSGPGFAREFIPGLLLTDVVKAPWHDRLMSADHLPFADGELGALVLFDVLHHLAKPMAFFVEATRALRPGGRLILCEPYISPLSHWVYRRFHEEPVDMSVDPFVDAHDGGEAKDPFTSNQATPTLMFCRDGARKFRRLFPKLVPMVVERFAGMAYPASGGFSRRPLLPLVLWKVLFGVEKILPRALFRLLGFRVFVVLERAG
jgi:SAM-dependent methyltransferase